ncbi:MAG TPA: NAD(P)H-dependent oxidoreductase subunit E [Tepidisphaeraceae bacterium]|jgi:NADH-quinone oxidoreductase subunit E
MNAGATVSSNSCECHELQLAEILARHPRRRPQLIPLLQDVQAAFGYLPESALRQVAIHLELSVNDVVGVATFYSQFRFEAPGRHSLKICEGTACHVRGSGRLMDAVQRQLGAGANQTTADGEFSIERVMCLGSCALAPAVVVDETVYGRVSQTRLEKLIAEVK